MQASAGVRAKARKAAAVVASKKLGSMPSDASSVSASSAASSASLISFPAMRMRSLKRTRCGLVKTWTCVPGGFERGAQESAGRALAVGAGDMKDGRKLILRPAEAVEQRGDALEPEAVAGVDRRSQPVELRLDRGIGRAREVGHQAAFFSGVR